MTNHAEINTGTHPEIPFVPCKILCVDDEPSVLSALKRLLRTTTYEVFIEGSGQGALTLMQEHRIDLVISDMRMPGMSGVEYLSEVAALYPDTIRILLTGYSDMESTIAAVNHGKIHHYIQKPWNNQEVLITIEQALEHKLLADENIRLSQEVEKQNDELIHVNLQLESRVQQRTLQIRETMRALEEQNTINKENNRDVLKVFYNLLSMNENLGGIHAMKIGELCTLIGMRLGYGKHELQQLKLAGLLHELGLLCMDSSLSKTPFFALGVAQKKLYRTHPLHAYAAMAPVARLSLAASIILHQYEQINGCGTPDKLQGEQIPEGSRILMIARDYMALTQAKLMPIRLARQCALDYVNHRTGSHYDEKIVSILPLVLPQFESDSIARNEKKIACSQLKPNMVLSRDVINSKEILLADEGHKLTKESIASLCDFENSDEQILKIYVLEKQH
ncbi:HD domain-containing phosphohydrolase [Neptunomonas antarctica]|uniref:Response regulator c-di-GMP phosphodiesterase, RpfG family, contains REC and HD-GYP domains n=1 Tax=Neptunomonas antarctica TaxID=619304 RepID=A0A1N7K419_9GAMM|nr:HD domain-containing phosphohydrolase [Neptunomonas antarctica]SIS56194.1 Response regulator c-di-GMP phosphodiesterase, RpfG family, contains REC and HD-GYP domains [Neptunomonas antarctica]